MITTKNTHDKLGSSDVSSLFWQYALPSILAMLATSAYVLVDGVFIGRVVGRLGLAAINTVYPLQAIIIGVGCMIGVGAAIQITMAKGTSNQCLVRLIFGNFFISLVVAGVVITALGLVSMPAIFQWMGIQKKLLPYAKQFMFWSYLGSFFCMSSLALIIVIRNEGQPKLSTYLMVLGVIINVVLDYILICLFKLELAGSAIATVVAQAMVSFFGVIYLFTKKRRLQPLWQPKISVILPMFYSGLASFFMEMNIVLFLFFHNHTLLRFGNEVNIAAFSVTGYVESIFFMVFQGITVGVQPIISYSMAYGLSDRLRRSFYYSLKVVFVFGFVALLFLEVMPSVVATPFIHDDFLLKKTTMHVLRVNLSTLPLDGYILLSASILQAMGRVNQALFVILGKGLLIAPIILVLSTYFGVDGVWLTAPLVNLMLAALLTYILSEYFFSTRKKSFNFIG